MAHVTPPSYKPTRKVTAGALAGAIVTVAVGVLSRRGIVVSPDEAAAGVVLCTFAVSYFVRDA